MKIIFSTIMQESNDLQKYYDLIFDVYNPIYISLFLILGLILLFYISYKFVYNPLLRKHKGEKENLELKSVKLLALFSELDPNPIIRINTTGNIVGLNKSAKEKFSHINSNGDKINSILNEIDFDIRDSIMENRSIVIMQNLNGKVYEINFHGISFLETAQLYFLDVTAKKEYEEQMNLYQKLLRDSSTHLQRSLDEQKNKFAGLLHDSIGQNLLLIKLNLQNKKNLIQEGLAMEEYLKTLELLDSSIFEVKETARNLRPLNIDELGLITVLNSMCNKVSKECNMKSYLMLPRTHIHLHKDLEVCIYSVVQEALNNIIKHSKASEFTVNLTVKDDSVTLIISDDGIGFRPIKLVNEKYVSDGLGLLSMQDRVERLIGTFHIDSSHNNGTIIIADFLLTKEANETELDYKNPGS
jgi:signal transduction histidine kinase